MQFALHLVAVIPIAPKTQDQSVEAIRRKVPCYIRFIFFRDIQSGLEKMQH